MRIDSSTLSLCAAVLAACASPAGDRAPATAMDPHSHARPDRVRVVHVGLDLDLDFALQRVRGRATLVLGRTDPRAPLVLDSKGLAIERVLGADGSERRFVLGEEHDGLGASLTIELEPGDERVEIVYATTPECEALQWLAPPQTAGGEHPFVFSQGQAVLTRTWIPLQDTPGVRVTYDARVRAPEPLVVLMSAQQLGRDADGTHRFRMDRAIPPYLIALAAGELASRPISSRAAVWAEPSVVERAAHEFADTEAMIASAERLFGPYRWERYDVLILPPAFPYGGMENPMLTFATPTVLAGDRSLVSLIAHELAHSWSGNLVTNATWRDFWLNEGFTVYLENRIMAAVYGEERASMERVLGLRGLVEEVERLEPWQTVLHIDLTGRHPDEGFSGVPYEKGALFLRRLEEVFGREAFDAFLTSWFDAHAFRSVTTREFEEWMDARLFAGQPERAAAVDVDTWLRGTGIPADAPRSTSVGLDAVEREAERWRAGAAPNDLETDGWVTQQWLHLLDAIGGDLDAAGMSRLDRAFDFTASGNSEILFAWLRLAIRHGYAAADARLEEFLMTVGRRKYLRPLYEELTRTEDGLGRARAIYARARPRYHAVSTSTLDRILTPLD